MCACVVCAMRVCVCGADNGSGNMSDGSSGNGVPAAATGYARLKSTMVG